MELGPIFRAMMRHRARFLLIALEVALTLAIVANSVSLILDARQEMTRPSGFDEENLIHIVSSPFADELQNPEQANQLLDEDLRTLRALPGVKAATHTTLVPWGFNTMTMPVRRAGTQDEAADTQFVLADEGFADTLGIRVSQGQNLTRADFEAARQAPQPGIDSFQGNVLLTQALAEAAFPEGNAVGQVLELPDAPGRFRVVGVLDKFYKPAGGPIDERAIVFPLPAGNVAGMSFLVRTEPGQRDALAADIEKSMLAVNDGRNVRVRTIQEIRKRFHTDDRLLVTSLNAVMVLLLLVTALGIIGLTSFSVTERRRQIGTRRALGASKGAIVRHFLLENWLIVTSGAVLGLALAFALNYGLVTWIDGTKLDLRMLAAGVVALWLTGILSALGPALRAAAVPPAIATRNV
jgi:putative ABC transport system permease protein